MDAMEKDTVRSRAEAAVEQRRPGLGEPPRRYLLGVQGLRTVAVLLVAVYHIWFHRISGGVDVFFVVAGYFAVSSLVRAFGRASGSRGVLRAGGEYLVRTARRVVPSASTVLLATILGAILWMPQSLWRGEIRHARASAVFMENWWLIRTSSDYLQQDAPQSPFQQFWALAVNVQFYFFAAVFLTIIALLIGNRRIQGLRLAITMFLALVLVTSLSYSIILTGADQPAAYFNTGARLWEFMIGGLTALWLRRGIRSPAAARLLGWAGLLLLLFLGAFLDLSRLLPGWLAILPVSAAVALIVSSWTGDEPALLRAKPVLLLADASFAIYLWHWPLLVFYRYRINQEVSLFGGLAIIIAAILLALATTRWIENPIRRSAKLQSSWVLSLLATALLMVPTLAAYVFWKHEYAAAVTSPATAQVPDDSLSSEAGGIGPRSLSVPVQDLRPKPVQSRDDNAGAYGRGCHQNAKDAEVIGCEWGDPSAPMVVALVGGSHSLQWLPAVVEGAEESNARVVSFTKSNCLFGVVSEFGLDRDPSCSEWNEDLAEQLIAMEPDLVVTIGTRVIDGTETVPKGYATRFAELFNHGIPVLAIRDNPLFDFDPPSCAEIEGPDVCTMPTDEWYVGLSELENPTSDLFTFVDTAPYLCSAGECGIVDGDILMYRDYNHLTNTWVTERGGFVGEAVAEALREHK